MSLSRGYNTATYTNGHEIATNVAEYECGMDLAQTKICAGPGHISVNPEERKSYYKSQGFEVTKIVCGERVLTKAVDTVVPKRAYICDGVEVDILIEIDAALQQKVTTCLYESYVRLFCVYQRRFEVVVEFSNGECIVVDRDSVMKMSACSVAHVTVRMRPELCRSVHTLDEISRSAALSGNYTMFAMALAKNGARMTSYSILYFSATAGFICPNCGKHMRSISEAVSHVGDSGLGNSYRKVVLGPWSTQSKSRSITICDARPSDFAIYSNYFEEYSNPVEASQLTVALQRLAPKRQRQNGMSWKKR